MRHALVTFAVAFGMRLLGADVPTTIKVGSVLSVGSEVVQWHAGPCVQGSLPSPLCGKPERRDVFAGLAGTLTAVLFTVEGKKPRGADVVIDLNRARIRAAIRAECDSVKRGTKTFTDTSMTTFARRVC